MEIVSIVMLLVGMASAAVAVYFFVQLKNGRKSLISDEKAISLASEKAKEIIKRAEEEGDRLLEVAEKTASKTRRTVAQQENLMNEREKALDNRARLLDKKATEVEVNIEKIKKAKKVLDDRRDTLKEELEKISEMTRDEAREKLMEEVEEDLKDYKAKRIREVEKEAEVDSGSRAKNILVEAMQSIATDYVSETTTTSFKIDDEKIKGRVIGKDGRNIRAFEKVTGVDLIIDEAPNEIGISSFDPIRREIAKIAMTRLVKDGRIHPGTIEEEVRKAKKELAEEIRKNGQLLAEEAGWPGIDPDLLKIVGKMKYRTSYGQSLMAHTIEVIRIGAVLAAEVGADVELVKRACLLHDMGKVFTHKIEGPHHHISGQIARKYGLSDKLINAIEAHHLDIETQSMEAVIVYIADAISGSRPGARKDSYEDYIKRVESIEKAAKEVGGNKVEEVFAIHAGREVRVIVKPNDTEDEDIPILAKKIAERIEKDQTSFGTVKVTVVREYRVEQNAN